MRQQRYTQALLFSVALAMSLGLEPTRALPEFEHGQESLTENSVHPQSVHPQSVADYYRQRLPIPHAITPLLEGSEARSIAHAEHMRDRFILDLLPEYGPIVGYKAALTSPPAQTRFGVDQPLRGILLQNMFLESGATVASDFGARPLFEPDLLVRVGSTAINDATTRQEALAALTSVIPFIELPDLMFASNVELDATDLIAINVGARLGVMGDEIPLDTPVLSPHLDKPDWVDVLGHIEVDMVAGTANEITQGGAQPIASGSSQALLGHPLDVVLWLVEDLKRSGQSLRPGDLLSLGSITAPIPVMEDQTISAQYHGLTEDVITVQVTFNSRP